MTSRDGHWRVSVISLDGTEYLRVAHDTAAGIPGGLPVHQDGAGRAGTVRVAGGWFLVGDFTSPEQVGRYVPLSELGA